MKQKLLFAFVILINIFSYAAVSYDKNRLSEKPVENREVRLLTVASFGGSFGLLSGLIISEHDEFTGKKFFMNGLKIIFLQNMIMIFLAVQYIHKEKIPKEPEDKPDISG